MPLLPIKDRDGDKEASTAGRKQTDKTNRQPRVSESHQASLCIAPQVQVLLGEIYESLPSSITTMYYSFLTRKYRKS